jgi:hypothetical protein
VAFLLEASDLATYLNLPSIDGARAELVLALAREVAEAEVTPLPDGARAIVLGAAGRAYTNPQQVPDESVGPFRRSGKTPGLFLTADERQTLKLLASRARPEAGAFTINPYPARPRQVW